MKNWELILVNFATFFFSSFAVVALAMYAYYSFTGTEECTSSLLLSTTIGMLLVHISKQAKKDIVKEQQEKLS